MRHHRICLMLVTLIPGVPGSVADTGPSLRGDAIAVERVTRMLDEMGGTSLWARSRQLHIVQHGWFTEPTEAAVETIWRSLESAKEYLHVVGRYTETTHIVTEEGAWTSRKGVISEMSPEEHAREKSGWFNGSYTMLYRLATGDQELMLKFVEPHRVRILDKNGEEISWYEINEFGHWMKWGRTSSDGTGPEYVYGPMKDFGNLRFPAWGASVDASWRYNYQVVELRYDSIDPSLLQRPD